MILCENAKVIYRESVSMSACKKKDAEESAKLITTWEIHLIVNEQYDFFFLIFIENRTAIGAIVVLTKCMQLRNGPWF